MKFNTLIAGVVSIIGLLPVSLPFPRITPMHAFSLRYSLILLVAMSVWSGADQPWDSASTRHVKTTCQGTPLASNSSLAVIESRHDEPVDCEKLPGRPQDDIRWNFETAALATCFFVKTKFTFRYWEVHIPNDHIFDETNIRKKGPSGCGNSVIESQSVTLSEKCMLDKVSCFLYF